MTPEDVDRLLRQAGRPIEPPLHLRRMVLNIPAGSVPSRRRWRTVLAAGAAAVLLLGAGAVVVQQLTAFHAVAAVTLQGTPGANAVAQVGAANGPNRPVQLVVQHLQPGRQSYYELWTLSEQPPMMLTTFMTDSSGSCTLTFSMPSSAAWTNLAITPEGQARTYLLRSRR